jgi:hypothetical protein
MNKNMGNVDRVLRGVLGLGLLAWAVLGSQDLHWIGWLGIIPLGTALVGFCPLYRIFGFNTCGRNSAAPRD